MSRPTITVEVAFNAGPLSPTAIFDDITAYVLHNPGIRISRGRPNESSTFSAGQLSLTLDNRDRRFDPLNAAGPYFGLLAPRRRIRVRATWSSTTYDMFDGFVTGWPTRYPQVGRMATVPLVAYDALALLNEIEMPDQVYRYADSTVGNLVRFFREAVGATWIDAATGDSLGATVGTPQLGGQPLAVSLTGSTPVGFDGNTGYTSSGASVAGAGQAWSVAFWVQTTSVGPSATDWMSVLSTPVPGGWNRRIGIDSAGILRYAGFDFIPGFRPSANSSIPVADGFPHHIVITSNTSGAPTIYVDGQARTSNQVAASTTLRLMDVGQATPGLSDTDFVGTLQDIAYFSKALSATEVNAFYGSCIGQFSQSTAARVDTILDSVGWPSSRRTITTVPAAACNVFRSANSTASEQLQLVAATEQGRLFVGKDGRVTLHDRFWSTSQARGRTFAATFSDDGADVAYSSFDGFDPGDRDIANDVTVVSGVGSQRSSDASSITSVGQRTLTVTTLLGTLTEAKAVADGIVYLRKTAQSRAQPITVTLTDTSTYAALLNLEIGDRYRVELTPMGVGSQISQQLHVESIDWDIDAAEWRVSVAGTPAPTSSWAIVGTTTVGNTDVTGY